MNIGKAIKILRAQNDINFQKTLAEDIGCNQSCISLFECNKRMPSLETLIDISEYFNMKLSDFIKLAEEL